MHTRITTGLILVVAMTIHRHPLIEPQGQHDQVCISTRGLSESWKLFAHYDSLYKSASLSIPFDSADGLFYDTFRPALGKHLIKAVSFSTKPCWIYVLLCCEQDGRINRMLFSCSDSTSEDLNEEFQRSAELFAEDFRVPLTLNRPYSLDGHFELLPSGYKREITGSYERSASFVGDFLQVNADSTFLYGAWTDLDGPDTTRGIWSRSGDTLFCFPRYQQLGDDAVIRWYFEGTVLYPFNETNKVSRVLPLKK